jgi:hypothetical protein
MTGWVHKWLHHGSRTGNGQPVDNQGRRDRLGRLAEDRHVGWRWLDVPLAAATDGEPQQRPVAIHATGAHADSQGDKRGRRANVEEEESERQREARMQDTKPDLMTRQATQQSTDDQWHALMAECQALEQQWAMAECQALERQQAMAECQALECQRAMAECQALERRWTAVHKEALHLDQEWQHLLRMITNRVEAQWNGQSPNWTDGALMFYHLDKHGARTSSLAREALQTCHHYALALQRALDAMAEQ